MDRITGDDTTDLGGGKRGFRGRNMLSGLRGTVVAAQWLNDVQEELLAVIESAETVPGAGVIQLVHAIRSQKHNYAQAGGTANALTAALKPALAAHVVGMPLRLKVKANNTDAATLNAGPGALPILSLSGEAIKAGDLMAGTIVSLVCTGVAWTLGGGAGGGGSARLDELEEDIAGAITIVNNLNNLIKNYVQQVRLGSEITAGVAADTLGHVMKRWYATGGTAGYDARFRPIQQLRNGVWVTVEEVV